MISSAKGKSIKGQKKIQQPLENAFSQLERESRRLVRVGWAITLVTGVNLFLALIFPPSSDAHIFPQPSALSILMSLISITGAIFFESERKRSGALFEEISDELQWNIREQSMVADVAPSLDRRVILRLYAKAIDLPLIPGKFGPAIYVVMNLVITLFELFYFKQRLF